VAVGARTPIGVQVTQAAIEERTGAAYDGVARFAITVGRVLD